ncbi:rubredoxin [Edwardsiella tarda]|uniref:rubredoxin n=1 Tax=Edwardsiella tarda TaxID=636 RepID=UPI000D510D45|nr:rubredoxin [Edwardsiella tarda]UCQ11781.1 rubredoxin [Edwardsiella tarda]
MFERGYGHAIPDEARLECNLCWWVYDPALGDAIGQIPAGTPFNALPEQWRCPQCDAGKQHFLLLE